MSKQRIDEYLPFAYEALSECGVAANNEINKTFRGQISTFGAAITMGSLLASVAFFSEQGGSTTERQKLMKSIHYVISRSENEDVSRCSSNSLFMLVKNTREEHIDSLKEKILDAAIALKLAMNLYSLKKDGKNGG